jgi:putative ABC transport system substrate-binding protein
MIRRREFIAGLSSGALVWPIELWGQEPAPSMRRLGVLTTLPDSDAEGRARFDALRKGLQELGWSEGRNLHIDFRWSAADPVQLRSAAAALVALKPDVIFAAPSSSLAALQRETRTVPVVFAQVADPVGTGFVASLARPGGNITGFATLEFGAGAKWLELIRTVPRPSIGYWQFTIQPIPVLRDICR